MVNFVNIPKELKTNASFCLWKLEKRSGKPTKVPYNPRTGQLAKTNDTIYTPIRDTEPAESDFDDLDEEKTRNCFCIFSKR